MRLIRDLRIHNFRSIGDLILRDLGPAVPFVGPNGVGKSNVLRALNVFFNGEVEPGLALDLTRDFHRPGRKVRRETSVAVRFEFPNSFKIPPALGDTARTAGVTTPGALVVERVWKFEGATRLTTRSMKVGKSLEDLDEVSLEQAEAVDKVLDLIRFRYIPNHVHPSAILQREEASLRAELLSRLKKTKAYKQGKDEQVFAEFANVAKKLVAPIARNLIEGSAAVEGVGLETPREWGDVAWEFALNLQTGAGDSFGTLLQGSGTQAHLMYLLIDFVDNSYGSTFGWRQASIWALEEPESFLHADLESRVASLLRQRSDTPKLQVLLTTHDPVFMAIGATGYSVGLEESATTVQLENSRELIDVGFKKGVSPFVHPLVRGAARPLLLVEGPSDVETIGNTYLWNDAIVPWEVHSLKSLDPTMESGGKDQIARYLSTNKLAINSRPVDAPLVVLLDWDSGDSDLKKCNAALDGHPTSGAYRMPEDLANPDLDKSFKGIERFLGTDVWQAAASQHSVKLHRPHDSPVPLRISSGELKRAKPLVHAILSSRRDKIDVVFLYKVLTYIDRKTATAQRLLT